MHTQDEVTDHFDDVASSYDYWKEKNWYYYVTLKKIAQQETAGASSVLDAGCGTGGVIAALKREHLVGVDISPQMVDEARRRYQNQPHLMFFVGDIATLELGQMFDRILFFDVIEHVERPQEVLAGMIRHLAPGGRIIVTMANPLWEPILMLAEKLHMKMPEGPHNRISARELVSYATSEGLTLATRDYYLIFPKYVPMFSYLVNNILGRLPLLRRLSVIEVFIFS